MPIPHLVYYLFLVSALILMVIKPATIPALLLFIFAHAEFYLPVINIGSGTVVTGALIVLLIVRYRYVNRSRAVVYFCGLLVLSTFLGFLGSWSVTGGLFRPVFVNSLKAWWGLLILVVPPETTPARDVIKYLAYSVGIGMILIGVFSIPYFIETGQSLGRFAFGEMQRGHRFHGWPMTPVPFAMDIHNSMIQSVMMAFPIGHGLLLFTERKLWLSLFWVIVVAFSFVVLIVNQYLISMIVGLMLFLWLPVFYALSSPSRIPRRPLRIFAWIMFLVSAATIVALPIILTVISDRLGLDGGYTGDGLRYSRLFWGLETFSGHFVFGTGFPTTEYVSGHSAILDRFTVLGFPFGLFANLAYLLPVYIAVIVGLRDKTPGRLIGYVCTALALGVLIQSAFNTFGVHHKGHVGMVIVLSVIFMNVEFSSVRQRATI